MNHELRILHKKFTEGEISRQEFRAYIEVELDKLEDELMEDALLQTNILNDTMNSLQKRLRCMLKHFSLMNTSN